MLKTEPSDFGPPRIEVRARVARIRNAIVQDGPDLTVTKGEIAGLVGTEGSGITVRLKTVVRLCQSSNTEENCVRQRPRVGNK